MLVVAAGLGLLLAGRRDRRRGPGTTQVGSAAPATPRRASRTIGGTASAATAPPATATGENAMWIDPKPRDFTAAVFKCRSTPDRHAADRRGPVPLDHPRVRDHQHAVLAAAHPARRGWTWSPISRRSPPAGRREGRDADQRAAGDAGDHREHPPRSGALPEDGMLEVPRARRARRRPLGLHADRQQGQPDPALQFRQPGRASSAGRPTRTSTGSS